MSFEEAMAEAKNFAEQQLKGIDTSKKSNRGSPTHRTIGVKREAAMFAHSYGISAAMEKFSASNATIQTWLDQYQNGFYDGVIDSAYHIPRTKLDERIDQEITDKKNLISRLTSENKMLRETIEMIVKTMKAK